MATIDVAGIMQELNNDIRQFMITGASYNQAIRSEGNIYARLLADELAFEWPANPKWINKYRVIVELERRTQNVATAKWAAAQK